MIFEPIPPPIGIDVRCKKEEGSVKLKVKSEKLSLNNAQKSIGTQLCGPQLCVLCVFYLSLRRK